MKSRFFRPLFDRWTSRHSLWLAGILIAGFLAFYWDATSPRSKGAPAGQNVENTSTMIPAGFVLVPIEVANYESLDSILGKHGVVDLYAGGEDRKGRQKKIAERIKILRAPLNPSHFAVLAPESESSRIVMHQGPFTVVVQHPNRAGTRFVNPGSEVESAAPKRRSRIHVEVEGGNED